MAHTKDIYAERMAEAVESALSASSEQSRIAYLQLAHHYGSMHRRVGGEGNAQPDADVVATIARTVDRPDFRSIHEALVEAA